MSPQVQAALLRGGGIFVVSFLVAFAATMVSTHNDLKTSLVAGLGGGAAALAARYGEGVYDSGRAQQGKVLKSDVKPKAGP